MFNPSVNTSNQNKSGKNGSKSNQKWTVLGDLNQFLASSNGSSSRSNEASGGGGGNSSSTAADSSHFREAGIIEKLLPSYGFIQCCERQARLFFHYSQFNGVIDHLRLGDAVEFEMTYDKRTGKPIASFVVKISSEAISEEVSAERVTGFITIELVNEKEGRVAYENRGECFFLPFSKDDLEDGSVKLRSKDRVTFVIAKDKNGTLRARDIAMETPSPQRFRGMICTLKDSFGFIERTDQVREIFFHSSECAKFKDFEVNDSVEFCIQVRNNKEVAGNVEKLEYGTANFEKSDDVGCIGQILEPIDHSKLHPHLKSAYNSYSLLKMSGYDPFPGKILYRKNGQEIEVALGFREVKYTLQVGDWVRFNITVDTRDQQSYATSVVLLEEDLKYSGEKREHGRVIGLNETGGCIQEMDGCRRFVFDFDELINLSNEIQVDSTVEFTPAENAHGSELPSAIRIRILTDSYASAGSTLRKGFISELNETFNCGVVKLFDQSSSGPSQVFFSFSELVSGIVPSINDRVEFKLHNTAQDVWKAAEVRVIGKAQAPIMDAINSTSNDILNGSMLQHTGTIRVMSRNLGILQSNQLKGQDIFFKVSDLPAQLFPANSEFEYMIDFDSNGLRAYDIRVSSRFTDSRQNGDGNHFNRKQNVEEENSGEKSRGRIFELSRECGYLRCDNEKKFYFEMSDFPILMVELNAEFEFAVAIDFGILNYLRAIDLNPISNDMNGIGNKLIEREKGFVVSLKKRSGFIQCLNKKGSRLPFSGDDLLDPSTALCLNDEVEFEIEEENFKSVAVRIQILPFGTITRNLMAKNQSQSEANGSGNNNTNNNSNSSFNGLQSKKTPNKFGNSSGSSSNNNNKQGFWQSDFQMDSFSSDYSTGNDLNLSNHYGGEEFDLGNDFKNLVSFENGGQPESSTSSSKFSSPKNSFAKARKRGFIAALKESYGFIESEDLQSEIFFHYSVFDGNAQQLAVLQEVEYVANFRNGKLSAEYVKKLPNGSIDGREVMQDVLNGVVTRTVRCLSPEQDEYCGLIQDLTGTDQATIGGDMSTYQFSMISLNDLHDFVHKDDFVTFQVAVLKNGQKVAVNVKPEREKHKATVDTIKGNFGFLDFEVEGGKKLFFHLSEVKDKNTSLQQGDKVEFVIVHNRRNSKHSACSIVKISNEVSQRPDRLILKCKSQGNDESKSAVMRQPKGPDGSKGFTPRS